VLVYLDNCSSVTLPVKVGGETSKTLHSYIVVKPVANPNLLSENSFVEQAERDAADMGPEDRYIICGAFKKVVGRFKPMLPRKEFKEGRELRHFLLHKLVNADRAAWHCTEEECMETVRRRYRQGMIDKVSLSKLISMCESIL
tara:strand:+ start:100 stop:528 length:429 start_codon:yes stop_codon:yes gene_type:complete